jgi:hypothetical protein
MGSLPSSTARPFVSKSGTFPDFAAAMGIKASLQGKTFALRDLLAQIPEMRADWPLLAAGHSAVARVEVSAFIQGDTS